MLITRETDYALRVLRALAGGEMIPAAEICRRELLPRQFVYKILKKLQRAGFVAIRRGAEGGCRLCRDLKQASLYDLVAVMGEDRAVSACMRPGFRCAWRESRNAPCNVHRQLAEIQSVLDGELRSRSLHRMLFGGDGEPSGGAPP